jgi:hypothetical protein
LSTAPVLPPCPQTAWLWLVDVPRGEKALVVGGPPNVGEELAEHYPTVVHADAWPPTLSGDGGFSCIVAVAPDFIGTLDDVDQTLTECHRLLQPGGALVVTQPNALFYGMLRTRTRSRGSLGIQRRLRRAGFRTTTRFFLYPDVTNPRYIIPDVRAAMIVHERGQEMHLVARRFAARAGLGRALYPGILTVAHS